MRIIAFLLALAACSSAGLQHDPLQSCHSNSDCAAGEICASDQTCWRPPVVAPPEPSPPTAPVLLSVVQDGEGIRVRWTASNTAVQYQVYRGAGGVSSTEYRVVAATEGLSELETFDNIVTTGLTYSYRVLAVDAAGRHSGFSAEKAVLFRTPFAGVSATGLARSIRVSFVPAFSTTYRLLRSDTPDGQFVTSNATEVVSFTNARWLVESNLGDDQTVYYQLEATDSYGTLRSIVVSATTGPQAPAQVSVSCAAGGLAVQWDPSPSTGITGYLVTRTDAFYLTQTVGTVGADVRNFLDSRFYTGDVQTYLVQALRGQVPGAAASATLDPQVPTPQHVQATAGVGRIDLSWDPVPNATSYVVLRWPTPVASPYVSGVTWADTAVQSLQQYGYAVRAQTACNVSPWPSQPVVSATPVSPPDQENLGSGPVQTLPVDGARRPAQTFTVGQTGRLDAIELSVALSSSASSAGYLSVLSSNGVTLAGTNATPVAAGAQAGLLGAPGSGTVYRLQGGLGVRAGQVLTFQFGPRDTGVVAVAADTYGGGTLIQGPHADSSRDLLFRTYVSPDTAQSFILAGGPPGLSTMPLAWPVLTGATSWEVRRNGALVTTVAAPFYTDAALAPGNYTWSVRALGPSLSVDSSNQVQASLNSLTPAAANLGLGGVTRAVAASHSVAQGVTLPQAGRLAAVEFSAVMGDAYSWFSTTGGVLRIRDSYGHVIGTASYNLALDSCCGPVPLTDQGLSRTLIDVSSLQLSFQAGEPFQLELVPGQPLEVLETGDDYAGGTELVDGTAVADHDLAFRVFVK